MVQDGKKMKVGFIGLGLMGGSMAMNLHKAGFPLTVYNRTQAKAEPFKREGIKVASSPREVAAESEVVILMVTDAPDVMEVLSGPHGVLEGAKQGTIVVDMGTNSPEHARTFHSMCASRGLRFLDAPVTGGDRGAREATLTIMVGGEREDVERVMPIFQAMGKTIVHAGGVGYGQMLKLLNQVVVGVNMLALAEVMTLAERAGIDQEILFKVLSTGAANSFTVQYYMPKVMKGDMEPGFRAAHLRKDLKYAVDVATKLNVPLLGTSTTLQLYSAMNAIGMGEKGTQALVKLYQRLTSP
jgi:3-hydroxyisobutyrate dehydrogenase